MNPTIEDSDYLAPGASPGAEYMEAYERAEKERKKWEREAEERGDAAHQAELSRKHEEGAHERRRVSSCPLCPKRRS